MNEEKENITARPQAAQGAAAREKEGAAAVRDLGKFKSVDALLEAYGSLEAEFTRRSQRLRELEGKERNNAAPSADENALPSAEGGHSAPVQEKSGTGALSEEARRAVIGEYLMSVLRGAPTVMAGGGTHVPAPERRPRDLGEAARLAAELFSKGD